MEANRTIDLTDTDELARIAAEAAAAAVPDALRAGARVPPLTLPDKHGTKVSLDSLLATGPVVLNFLRGDWCSFGEDTLTQFASMHEQIAALGAAAIAIAPPSQAGRHGRPLPIPELVDTNMKVARAFGLAFDLPEALHQRYLELGYVPPRSRAGSFLVPIPATYLVGQEGVVVLAYVDVDYRNRLDVGSLLTALQALHARRGAERRSMLLSASASDPHLKPIV